MADIGITDMTDPYWEMGQGDTLENRIAAVAKDLARRVELLAKATATSVSATTERGIRHTAYCNGAIKLEAESARMIVAEDLTADAQMVAFQTSAQETYETILANKPVGKDLLIWRILPEASRALHPDGLHIKIYTRLSWDEVAS